MTLHQPRLSCSELHKRLQQSFAQLSEAYPAQLSTYDFSIAGRRVVGRFVGAELARIFRTAFEPHAGDAPPALEICLWDETPDTGIDPRLGLSHRLNEQQLRQDVVTGTSVTGRYVCHIAESWLNILDLEQPALVGCVLDRSRFHLHERARPLEWPLRFWLRRIGLPVLHAGLVSHEGAGILIGGPAGAGKSTLALACLDAGFGFLSDDKIGLETVAPGVFVGHRLYRSILASVDVLQHFPQHRPHAHRLETDALNKAILMASDLFPDRIQASSPIAAVILPRRDVSHGEAKLVPARRVEAMTRMLPNCLPLYPTWDSSDIGRLSDLLRAVPVHWLEGTAPPTHLPQLVAQALPQPVEPPGKRHQP